MLFYAEKSSRKIVHYSGCKYLTKRMTKSRGSFDSIEDAHLAGYRLCKCCSPIARHYQKERRQILNFCAAEGLSCYQSDGRIIVTTPMSRWQIITAGKKNTLFLYHKNTNSNWKDARQSMIPGYHSQAVRKDTICGYLAYISAHDAYRCAHPAYSPKPPRCERPPAKKGSKRWRKEQRRDAQHRKRSDIRNVLNLIDHLQSTTC